jgi:uncharacterized protein YodC (DUF2158 family)
MSKDEKKRRRLNADNLLEEFGSPTIRARQDKTNDEIGRFRMTRMRVGIVLRDSNLPAITATRDHMTKQQWADLVTLLARVPEVDEITVTDAVNSLGLLDTVSKSTTAASFAWDVTHVWQSLCSPTTLCVGAAARSPAASGSRRQREPWGFEMIVGLKVGDAVRLKTRGPRMTVTSVDEVSLTTRWIDKVGLQSGSFALGAVKRSRQPGPVPKSVVRHPD